MGWPGPMTHRQFEAWQAWLAEQWNQPSRTDNYLMQIACEVLRTRLKEPGKAEIKHFRLEFKEKKPPTKQTAAEVAAEAKARWRGMIPESSRVPPPMPTENPDSPDPDHVV